MPVVPFLETTLGAPAIKLPISQATDYSALQVRGMEGREGMSWIWTRVGLGSGLR